MAAIDGFFVSEMGDHSCFIRHGLVCCTLLYFGFGLKGWQYGIFHTIFSEYSSENSIFLHKILQMETKGYGHFRRTAGTIMCVRACERAGGWVGVLTVSLVQKRV